MAAMVNAMTCIEGRGVCGVRWIIEAPLVVRPSMIHRERRHLKEWYQSGI
jgi:hypothetical protein